MAPCGGPATATRSRRPDAQMQVLDHSFLLCQHSWDGRLTYPRPAPRISLVTLPPWGSGRHDKGKDRVKGYNQLSNSLTN